MQVEKAIKAMPTLQEKVQAIAINGYMEQKKALDDTLEKEINKIDLKYRLQMQPLLDKVDIGLYRSTPSSRDQWNSRIRTSRESRTSSLTQSPTPRKSIMEP